jgi:uncharacterized protein (TIGR02466 family)
MSIPSLPPDGHVALAFPTLIGRFQITGTEAINERLAALVLEREAATPSRDYANQGGWHSANDLLEWPGDDIAAVRGWCSEGLTRMVQATAQLPEVQGRGVAIPRGAFRIMAWANVARRGNYHRMHNHPGSAWSGCYYVASPPSEPGTLAGALEFYDPRPFTEMMDVPGSPYGQRMIVRPLPGLLVLFPSWLYHFVHPSTAETPRISIAFNAQWRPA